MGITSITQLRRDLKHWGWSQIFKIDAKILNRAIKVSVFVTRLLIFSVVLIHFITHFFLNNCVEFHIRTWFGIFFNIFHLFRRHQCGSTVLHCSRPSEHNASLQKMAPNSVQFYYLLFVQYILFWFDFCTESEPSRARFI